MPTYGYLCEECGKEKDEFHGMLQKPIVKCDVCGGFCIKLVGTGSEISGMDAGRCTYDFVDFNTTGKPVVINNKKQWKEHLRRHGLHDDVKNTPYTKSEITYMEQKEKNKNLESKRKIKEAVTEAVRDKRHIEETKKKYKKILQNQKGG